MIEVVLKVIGESVTDLEKARALADLSRALELDDPRIGRTDVVVDMAEGSVSTTFEHADGLLTCLAENLSKEDD